MYNTKHENLSRILSEIGIGVPVGTNLVGMLKLTRVIYILYEKTKPNPSIYQYYYGRVTQKKMSYQIGHEIDNKQLYPYYLQLIIKFIPLWQGL